MKNREELRLLIESIVREQIEERLKKDNSFIIEMAIERKEYVNKCDGIIRPLMRHVLLLSYCRLYNQNNRYMKHWKDEIWAFCDSLVDYSLKDVQSSHQEQVKRKALTYSWFERCEIDTDRMINGHWKVVSRKENINYNVTPEMKEDYLKIINNLITLISKSDISGIDDYIYSL
jgi:hypothetical protein